MKLSKKFRTKYISSFSKKPKFQLSSLKKSYRQNINYDDLINILTSNSKWNYLENFLTFIEKKSEAVKKYGMCFIIKKQPNKKLVFQLVHGKLSALESLDKSLIFRNKINCSLNDYQLENANEIYKKCRKPPSSNNNNDFYTFNTGNTIVLPNINNFKISDIAHAYSFIKNVKKNKRRHFWNLVGKSLNNELQNSKNKNIKICIHIGPCHQQGTPIFHIKIGKDVAKCLVGNHVKKLTKKMCRKNWNKTHNENWLMELIKPQKI